MLIQVWRGEVTPESVQGLLEAGRGLIRRHPHELCSSLSVIERSSPAPNDRIRPLLSACYRELSVRMPLQLFVAEGSGFRAALIRGVGVAVSTFAPSLLPFKFASSVSEAATTIAPQLSRQAGGKEALVAAVAELRAQLDQHCASDP